MKRLILVLTVLMVSTVAMAQQQQPFTQYMINKQLLNPAYVGSRGALSIMGGARQAYSGLDGAPQTVNFGMHVPLGLGPLIQQHGVGIVAVADQFAYDTRVGVYGQYAYRVAMPDGSGVLAMGIQAGVEEYRRDIFGANFGADRNGNDVDVPQEAIDNVYLPNVGAGLYFYSNNYFLGLSVPQLVDNLLDEDGAFNTSPRHYYFTAGGLIDLDPRGDVVLRPTTLLKWVEGQDFGDFGFDLNMSVILYERLGVGAGFRWNESVAGMVEVHFTEGLMLGYAYDLAFNEMRTIHDGSHEVVARMDIFSRRNGITTPRKITFF